ncbi:MAG: hypothetical protein ACNS60_16495 [Candidatus Cyclobacteriaceae bacterium M2_1C_046]
MNKLFLSLILLFLQFSSGICQTGDYYITHHTPNGNADPSSNFSMVQHPNGILSFANRSGILQFDGKNWEIFGSKGTPLDLIAAKDGVYAAGIFGVGFYSYNDPEHFFTLHDDRALSGVNQIELFNDTLIGLSSDNLFIFSASEKKLLKSLTIELSFFQKILVLDKKPLIVTSKGNYWLENGKLAFADDVPDKNLAFSLVVEEDTILGTTDGQLFKKEVSNWIPIDLNMDFFKGDFLNLSFSEGISVGNGIIAISSVNEGVLIIDYKSKKLKSAVNQHNGLSDNEIFFISSDREGGIWVGHAFGLSRIDINLPYGVYENFPGLEGNLQVVVSHKDNIFVGTSTGLYKLDQIKDYEDVTYFVKKKKNKEKAAKDTQNTKGLFDFLKRKQQKEESPLDSLQPDYTLEKRIEKRLASVDYVFKKIEQIDSKVIQLLSVKDELLVVTLNGLFLLRGEEINLITAKPVKFAWIDKDAKLVIANTYSGELLTFEKNKLNEWQQASHFAGYQDFLLDIYQDSKSRIWFVSAEEVYWLTFSEGEIIPGAELSFTNSYLHPTYVFENSEGEIIVKNKEGVFVYDEFNKRLIYRREPLTQKFIKTNNELWEFKGDRWRNSKGFENKWLNVLDDVSYIDLDEDQSIYLISGANQLLKISPNQNDPQAKPQYPIVVKSIKDNGEEVTLEKTLRFIQRQSDLTFEIIQPEYSGIIDVKYQYRIKGLSDGWSPWAGDNNIIFLPFVPEGSYKLEIRSKNDFGFVQKLSAIPFEVVPPYWQRPWFYAFEFTILAILLFVTIHLNHNAPRYQLFNKLLAFLTLILIIEFIQVSAESKFPSDFSPVVAFFIQVVIAFIVLPVEGFLRKVIMRDKKISFKSLFIRGKKSKIY